MKQLRKYSIMILWVSFICLLTNACKEEEETFPTFPAPAWSANPGEYQVNMTAVVKLPSNLIQYAQEDDQLAAFAGEKCVGTGKQTAEGVYYVTIFGTSETEPQISFQYYSAQNRYLYNSGALFAFETNKVFGVADAPEEIPFSIVK
jgi:hypothetical protein